MMVLFCSFVFKKGRRLKRGGLECGGKGKRGEIDGHLIDDE